MVNELIKTIFARRSIRKYTTELVGEKDVKTMLEAAMAAHQPQTASLGTSL